MTRDGSDRGAVLEQVIITPVVLLLVGIIIAGGRISFAHEKVELAAFAAARAASIARTGIQAAADARVTAEQNLIARGLDCVGAPTVTTDVAGFMLPPGKLASVTIGITCAVSLDALLLPGIGGTRVITASATSPIDTFRERAR
ncbi:TadE/TadG family type IV pilus assembly protein [Nocardia terpenica]|uniref:Pilus assembly protein n=1 Tax=Nocardia terpenica TaxID=455432 RepID=A0A6G9ZB27_9NOCA|nr:TadE/TadG family type IV pilus assembly protein [Nocardia terpenica]QIS22819.1 pilus assembly protein [Nocardia terpenica]